MNEFGKGWMNFDSFYGILMFVFATIMLIAIIYSMFQDQEVSNASCLKLKPDWVVNSYSVIDPLRGLYCHYDNGLNPRLNGYTWSDRFLVCDVNNFCQLGIKVKE